MTGLPGYPCPICKRAGGAVTISYQNQMMEHLCSDTCAALFIRAKGQPKMEQYERDAAAEGGNAGGAYLDRIGKTDLASLTRDEWVEFCSLIFTGAAEALRKRADDTIPF